jgi:2-aminoadipate transaminase
MSPEIIFDPYTSLYSGATALVKSSEVRDLMSVIGRADIISFAGGLPFIEGLPVEYISATMQTVISESYTDAFQYGETEGRESLKSMLVEVMAEEGLRAEPEHVLITTGSQQALDLLARIFIDKGDRMVVEGPTYIGALAAFRPANPDFVTISLDESGLQVELLGGVLDRLGGAPPKFIYVVPNFHNPGGVTMTAERRRELLELARERDLLIIEDNPYGLLRFEGEPLEPLAAADRRRVVYVGTLSKIISPGIRTGWMLAPAPILERIAKLKQGADLCSPSLSQMFAEQFIRQGLWKKNLEALRPIYRSRRDAMLAGLEEHFPSEASWTRPEGGLFIWVTLPRYLDTSKMLPLAILQKVAYVPGTAFFADGSGAHHMRLNFSYADEERIAEGTKRLGKVIKREMRLCRSLGLDTT